MNKLLPLALVVLIAACTEVPQRIGHARTFDRAAVVELAKAELIRRAISLPGIYEVNVVEGEVGNEIGPPRPVYAVSFAFDYRGRRLPVIIVYIDKQSGRIDMVSDYRSTIPSRA